MATVLVIEDERTLREALALTLTPIYTRVLTAADGEAGLAAIEESRPDIVLLDIMLPLINGWDVKRRMNQDPSTARIPVVAVTALASREYRALARELGFAAFVAKPMRLAEIRTAIDGLLAGGNASDGTGKQPQVEGAAAPTDRP